MYRSLHVSCTLDNECWDCSCTSSIDTSTNKTITSATSTSSRYNTWQWDDMDVMSYRMRWTRMQQDMEVMRFMAWCNILDSLYMYMPHVCLLASEDDDTNYVKKRRRTASPSSEFIRSSTSSSFSYSPLSLSQLLPQTQHMLHQSASTYTLTLATSAPGPLMFAKMDLRRYDMDMDMDMDVFMSCGCVMWTSIDSRNARCRCGCGTWVVCWCVMDTNVWHGWCFVYTPHMCWCIYMILIFRRFLDANLAYLNVSVDIYAYRNNYALCVCVCVTYKHQNFLCCSCSHDGWKFLCDMYTLFVVYFLCFGYDISIIR